MMGQRPPLLFPDRRSVRWMSRWKDCLRFCIREHRHCAHAGLRWSVQGRTLPLFLENEEGGWVCQLPLDWLD